MKKLMLIILLFFQVIVLAQDNELDLKLTVLSKKDDGLIFAPDNFVLVVYSTFTNLKFKSNVDGIDDIKVRTNEGKYIILLKTQPQKISVLIPGYKRSSILVQNPEAGQVLYYSAEPSIRETQLIRVEFLIDPVEAEITIDNIYKGKLSTHLLTPGEHKIEIKKDGYGTVNDDFIVSSQNMLFKYTLKAVDQVGITIKSEPKEAQIYIDGVLQGQTNKSLFLYPGKYTVKLSKSGYLDETMPITVTDKEGETFSKQLTRNVAFLSYTAEPADAEVYLNKERITERTIELAPGRYKVEVKKENYTPYEESFEIALGERLNKEYRLKAKTGTLRVAVEPAETEIELTRDGRLVQNWVGIKTLNDLLVGKYTLTASAPGYKDLTQEVLILENKTSTKDLTLKRGDVFQGLGEFIFVEGGIFPMGSRDGQDDEKPVHKVKVSSFYLGKFEVTQHDWEKIMEKNPSKFKGKNLPLHQVSWEEIQVFLKKLNKKTGMNYRLPTEAEWEYAARGGNKSKGYIYSGSNNLEEVAWFNQNSESKLHKSGEKQPNELGLYDMSGNLWEWCNDWYDELYYKDSVFDNPKGPIKGKYRILRGGSWYFNNFSCRVADRVYDYPTSNIFNYGFRLCHSAE